MRRLGLGLLLLLVTSPPIAADWLIMTDGARLETRGKWQIKGPMVVFTNRQGTFSSLPLSEIDLETSRNASSATPQIQAPKSKLPPVVQKPVMVLTNADIRPARQVLPQKTTDRVPSAEESADALTAQDFSEPAEFGKEGVRWQRISDGSFEGVEVVGTLENDGEGMVTDLGVMVSLRDEYDQVIATQRAVVQARSLMPGTFTRFQARFADLEIEEDEQARVEVHCKAKRLREEK